MVAAFHALIFQICISISDYAILQLVHGLHSPVSS